MPTQFLQARNRKDQLKGVIARQIIWHVALLGLDVSCSSWEFEAVNHEIAIIPQEMTELEWFNARFASYADLG